METYKRICLIDEKIEDGEKVLELKRGEEYITSKADEKGEVTVFSSYWASGIPSSLFGGEIKFT